jgi:hypothetical protein
MGEDGRPLAVLWGQAAPHSPYLVVRIAVVLALFPHWASVAHVFADSIEMVRYLRV